MQYLTAYSDRIIIIALNSYSGELSSSRKTIIRNIADSAVFDQTSQATPTLAVTSGSAGSAGDLSRFSFRNTMLDLVFTVILCSLPIIIYRYAIKKEPVEKKKARKITIIYGVCAFLVSVAIVSSSGTRASAGTAVVFWSFVNYFVLTRGHKAAQTAPEVLFCSRCGSPLEPGSNFCGNCGERVIRP